MKLGTPGPGAYMDRCGSFFRSRHGSSDRVRRPPGRVLPGSLVEVRRPWLLLLVALAACAPSGGERAPSPSTGGSPLSSTASTGTSTRPPTTTTLAPFQGLAYHQIGGALPFPTFLTARPGSAVAYLSTKDGRVWAVEHDRVLETPVLDLRTVVRDSGEQGLLGMALHPTDPARFYLHYSAKNGDTVVAEYRFGDGDGLVADPASARVLLRLSQPAANHNGGMLTFGPDGYLYLGLGDGGGEGDRFGNGQNTGTLLATIVRIAPDGGIPPDNPFAGGGGAPEIWAYGLRNPWRFWIDPPSGLIYIADVGQNAYEEVDVVPLRPVGYDFGWPIVEGLHCYRPSRDCSTDGLTPPVLEVAHGDGGACSITGGVVYRGPAIPELTGTYFYSDYCGGWLRSFRWTQGEVAESRDWTSQVGKPGAVTSFGVDGAGEMYVLTSDGLYRVVPRR